MSCCIKLSGPLAPFFEASSKLKDVYKHVLAKDGSLKRRPGTSAILLTAAKLSERSTAFDFRPELQAQNTDSRPDRGLCKPRNTSVIQKVDEACHLVKFDCTS